MVATPPATCSCPTVSAASCRYGIGVQAARVSRARSRRPNSPAVQPWEGSSRISMSTWPGSISSLAGVPTCRVGSVGTACPATRWWWVIAASRRRIVAGAPGHPALNAVMVAQSAGSGVCPAAAHQSVNSAQSAAYPARVWDESTLPVNCQIIWFWLRFREADGLPIAAKTNVQSCGGAVAR